MKQAIAAVDEGMSMKKVLDTYGIPYSTFYEWCYGVRKSKKRGRPGVLTATEEEEIVRYLVRMCEMGYGLTPTTLKMKVSKITKSRWTPFTNGISGDS
jgi:transposase